MDSVPFHVTGLVESEMRAAGVLLFYHAINVSEGKKGKEDEEMAV
jgi:hypothetical protein